MKELLCDKEVAALPGFPALGTLRAARAQRAKFLYVPPHTRIGGRVRYRAADLVEWAERRGIALRDDL